MALEPRIEAIRKEYGLAADDFWQIKQNGQWVCKHAALEVVSVKAKIEWLQPTIIEANAPELVTSMIVTGKMGERMEWSTGETNATNYSVKGKQPAYPWAMSEKRAKDRVILKLVGLHGFVYSDAEGDFAGQDDEPPVEAQWKETNHPLKEADRRALWARMMDDLQAKAPKGSEAMIRYMQHPDTQRDLATLEPWKDRFRREAADLIKVTQEAENALGENVASIKPTVEPDFDSLASEHHGDRI